MAENKEEFSKFIAENKGKRKFKQTVELAINFKGIDFTKQDNRLNLEVNLPNGKGKTKKVAVFSTDRNLSEQAKTNGVEVIDGAQIEQIGKDPARLNSLLEYELIAQPSLMPVIAKNLGQFLGTRNKMPKPLIGSSNIANISEELNKRIQLRNRGKNLPTIHCIVGTEDMEPEKIYANVQEVISTVTKKVGNAHVRSAYVKLTMSKPFKVA
ncbi:MAG: 50S ribosomal protein L1 [Candidatus Micrarchaeota archaeon]|nr:50S ribosomal protein L1 [Candidatus Micrarchaeota archaeon]MDE1859875.1 50S ribosomal protein L1 [Candidatus Micrarchaeota archaeon]